MSSLIETIKAKVDVVEEIGLVVALKKSGKSYKGLCPFHNERTPSFYVFADTQNWHCFGCNEGGDIFSFVQKQQSLDFREALTYLAEKAGIAQEEYTSAQPSEEEREANVIRARLRKLNEDAFLWFHQALLRSREAAAAREYVQSRGISSEAVHTFGIGYAFDQWDGLTRYLLGEGYTERELLLGGLARERETRDQEDKQRGIYDYFRNRLIFPIRDGRGHVIGFGGRALGNSKPKYLNSPQTLLFEKNNVLYAMDMARDAIKEAGQVIIVEGYVDAVIAHQYGTKQTVACIGSAITEKHIQQLKKLTRQVTLALDPDAAGSAATEHGIKEALRGFDRTVVPIPVSTGNTSTFGKNSKTRAMIRLEEEVDAEINVLQLPAGRDPDEVIIQDFSSWLYAVSHPLSLVDYYFVVKTEDLNLRDPAGKTEAARRLLPVIGTIVNRIKRDAYIRKLASMISVNERTLYEELQRVLREQKLSEVTATFSEPTTRRSAQGAPVLERPSGSSAQMDTKSSTMHASRLFRKTVELDKEKPDRLQWEDYLIGLLLLSPDLKHRVCGIIDDGDFAGTDTRELYRILAGQRNSSPSHQSVEQSVPAVLLNTVDRARKRAALSSPKDGEGLVREATQCATRLKRARLLQLNTDLQNLIREASDVGDKSLARQLQQQLLSIYQQLRTIDTATHLQG